MIELLHWTFARKTSSFSAHLFLHAAKPDVTLHGNHTHTTCSQIGSHRNTQECVKTSAVTVNKTELPCPTCVLIYGRDMYISQLTLQLHTAFLFNSRCQCLSHKPSFKDSLEQKGKDVARGILYTYILLSNVCSGHEGTYRMLQVTKQFSLLWGDSFANLACNRLSLW